jgi:hypothetical protein
MKRFLMSALIIISSLSTLLSMQTETTPLLDQQKKYLEALESSDLDGIRTLLRNEQAIHPHYRTLSALGIACECLNTTIRNLDAYRKEPQPSWGCCCTDTYPHKLEQNIAMFKKIIVILAQCDLTLSDQISVELTLQLLRGPYEDKELSELLRCYLRRENEDLSYQRYVN